MSVMYGVYSTGVGAALTVSGTLEREGRLSKKNLNENFLTRALQTGQPRHKPQAWVIFMQTPSFLAKHSNGLVLTTSAHRSLQRGGKHNPALPTIPHPFL